MKEGSGMVEFEQKFPDRFYDVAIAEQHSVTFGSGLFLGGLKPVVAIYSSFLQRAYDQFIHDVCLENLDVTFALDRAGVVGEDGPTHSGNFDLAFMRCVPNIIISTPSDENELWKLLNTSYHYKGPAAIRYPRGSGVGAKVSGKSDLLDVGKANKILDGSKTCILNFGVLLSRVINLAEEQNFGLYDMRFVKPIDTDALDSIFENYSYVITLEDHSIVGGAGSAVGEYLHRKKASCHLLSLGLNDEFPEHGTRDEILKINKLDEDGIRNSILEFID
jgi:1-deoxy-D-xylulose-5-phosphate synthase